jgi:hypothetical protein
MEVQIEVEYKVRNRYSMDGTKSSQVHAEIKWPQPTEIKGTPLGRGATRESAFADLSERIRIESGVIITVKQPGVSSPEAKQAESKPCKLTQALRSADVDLETCGNGSASEVMKVKKVSDRELKELTGCNRGYFGAFTRIYHVPEKGVYVCGATNYDLPEGHRGRWYVQDWVAVDDIEVALRIARGATCGLGGFPRGEYSVLAVHNTKKDLLEEIADGALDGCVVVSMREGI